MLTFRPQTWTHHHETRILHISLLAGMLLCITAVCFGMVITSGAVGASSVQVTNEVGTTGKIPGAEDEVSTPIPTPTPSPTPTPNGGNAFWALPTASTTPTYPPYPPAGGSTPESLKYPVVVKPTPSHPIKPTPIPINRLELTVNILKEFQEIKPGQDIVARISVTYLTPTAKPVEIPLLFSIVNDQGDTLLESDEFVYVQDQVILEKRIHTYTNLDPGLYTFQVQIPTTTGTLEKSSEFQVLGSPVFYLGSSNRVDRTVLIQALLLLFFFFLFVAYFEYNKIKLISEVIHIDHLKQLKHA